MAPEVEGEVLVEVSSYADQLGRIGDALTVLIKRFHSKKPLTEAKQDAPVALRVMLNEIADIEQHHQRQALRV